MASFPPCRRQRSRDSDVAIFAGGRNESMLLAARAVASLIAANFALRRELRKPETKKLLCRFPALNFGCFDRARRNKSCPPGPFLASCYGLSFSATRFHFVSRYRAVLTSTSCKVRPAYDACLPYSLAGELARTVTQLPLHTPDCTKPLCDAAASFNSWPVLNHSTSGEPRGSCNQKFDLRGFKRA